MSTQHPVEAALAQSWPPEAWQDVTVLVAVSGGADSVALLRAMVALKRGGPGRLCVAHLNHQLRGSESAADAAFVVELCGQLGLRCEVGRAPVASLAANSPDGIEAAARTARYGFFRRTAERLGARYLVTAHTADDQAETILHRLVRGTGIAGLSGMARARPLGSAVTLIRPLLAIRRRQLLAYLDDLEQPYRRDSSNDDVRFTRNRVRHHLLPELAEQFNPGVVDALVRTGRLAGEVQEVIDGLVEELAARCVRRHPWGEVRIDTAVLAGQPRYVIRELLVATWRDRGWPLQAMGFAQWDRLAEMARASLDDASAAPPRCTFPGNVSVDMHRGTLRLARPQG